MAKRKTPAQPRLVVYVSREELKSVKLKASADGLRTPHQWLAALMRRELAKEIK